MAIYDVATDDRTMADINITPFTDVLLVLLIIFMLLAAMAVPPGFQKALSHAPASGPVHPAQPIVVQVTRGARFFVDGRPVAGQDLYAAMAAAVRTHAGDPVHFTTHIELLGSSDTPYEAIVRVLDAGRQAGDDDVGLVIQ